MSTKTKAQIDELSDQAWMLIDESPTKAHTMALQIYEFATTGQFEKSHYQLGVIQSQLVTSFVFYRQEKYGEAISLANAALEVLSGSDNHIWVLRSYITLGLTYRDLGELVKAMDFCILQLEKAEEMGSKSNQANAYMNMGFVHWLEPKLDRSREYLERALSIFEEEGNDVGKTWTLYNLGDLYSQHDSLEIAESFLTETLKLSLRLELPKGIGLARGGLGSIFIKKKAFEKAIPHLEFVYQYGHEVQQPFFLYNSCNGLGQIYLEQKQFEKARVYFNESLALAEKSGNKRMLSTIYNLLADLDEAEGNFEQALYHIKTYHEHKNFIHDEKMTQKLERLMAVHRTETAEKEAEIHRLKTVELEEQVEERTEALQNAFQRETVLAQQLEVSLIKEVEMTQLKAHIINVVSHEFRTPLTIINNASTLLSDFGSQMSEEKSQTYHDRIRQQVFFLHDLLQDIFFINQSGEEEIQLNQVLIPFSEMSDRLAEKMKEQFAEKISLTILTQHLDMEEIWVDLEQVERVVQSVLTNVVKYAAPKPEAVVRIMPALSTFRISISDNGIGIPEGEEEKIFNLFYRASNVDTERGMGLGLNISQTLLKSMGGRIWAVSAGINQGTTFHIELPKRAD